MTCQCFRNTWNDRDSETKRLKHKTIKPYDTPTACLNRQIRLTGSMLQYAPEYSKHKHGVMGKFFCHTGNSMAQVYKEITKVTNS